MSFFSILEANGGVIDYEQLFRYYRGTAASIGMAISLKSKYENKTISEAEMDRVKWTVWLRFSNEEKKVYNARLKRIGAAAVIEGAIDSVALQAERKAWLQSEKEKRLAWEREVVNPQMSKLMEEKNRLANTLHTFAPTDNAGRKAVMDMLYAIDDELKGLVRAKRAGEMPQAPESLNLMQRYLALDANGKKDFLLKQKKNYSKVKGKIRDFPEAKNVDMWETQKNDFENFFKAIEKDGAS